jgi:hypothetical protein
VPQLAQAERGQSVHAKGSFIGSEKQLLILHRESRNLNFRNCNSPHHPKYCPLPQTPCYSLWELFASTEAGFVDARQLGVKMSCRAMDAGHYDGVNL